MGPGVFWPYHLVSVGKWERDRGRHLKLFTQETRRKGEEREMIRKGKKRERKGKKKGKEGMKRREE